MLLEFPHPKIQVSPNLGIKCGTSSAGEPKMGTILRQGGQVSEENNTLIILESKIAHILQ